MNAKVDGRSARGRPRFGWMDGVKRALNDRRMDMREASERARNGNEWRMIVTQFWLASAVDMGLPYRGSPVVGAVGEMASMKRRKLWKTGEDRLCCSSSAIQTRPGPSSLLEEWSKTPIVLVFSLCCRLPSKLGGNGQGIQIDHPSSRIFNQSLPFYLRSQIDEERWK